MLIRGDEVGVEIICFCRNCFKMAHNNSKTSEQIVKKVVNRYLRCRFVGEDELMLMLMMIGLLYQCF